MKRSLMVLLIVCAALSAWDLSALSNRRKLYEQRQRQQDDCRRSLRSLYNFFQNYANAHQGKLPAANNFAGLKELIRQGASELNFRCPDFDGKKVKSVIDLTEKRMPFLYFGGANLFLAQQHCPKLPLACDKPGTRHLNVLLMDGTVSEIDHRRVKVKISNCQSIVEALNEIYKYPAPLLKALRANAQAMDEQLKADEKKK